jgi:hypothetical protein
LYGCETWALTLKEEHRLRVFEKTVLKGIFGPNWEVMGDWRRLHNEQFHNLREEYSRFRVSENGVLRTVFGRKREEVMQAGEDYIMRNFITCTLHQILLGCQVKEDEVGGSCSKRGKNEKCIHNFCRKI